MPCSSAAPQQTWGGHPLRVMMLVPFPVSSARLSFWGSGVFGASLSSSLSLLSQVANILAHSDSGREAGVKRPAFVRDKQMSQAVGDRQRFLLGTWPCCL